MNIFKTIPIIVTFLIISFYCNAQIINTESLRMVTDTIGWSGTIDLSMNLSKNTKKIFNIDNKIHIQYKTKKSIFLFLNSLELTRYNGNNLISTSIQHLRYNYKLNSKLAWEAFVQTQNNAISKIDISTLFGTGSRFKLTNSEKYKIYLGTLLIYEYDKSTENIPIINRDFRLSTYISFSLYPSDSFSIISTTYYQPKLRLFDDYRISNENSIFFKIFKNLSFKSTFKIYFDEFPVLGIPKKQYSFTNGLVYSFQ